MRGLVSLLVLTLVFAGCAGSSAESNTDPPATQTVSVGAPEGGDLGETGSVEGVVVDEAVSPIAGAAVGLEGFAQTATTGNDGSFVFTGVPVGSYQVFAAALGYSSVGKRVDVIAGQPAKVTFTLTNVAVVGEVYSELVIFKGYMPCGFGLVAVTVTANCPINGEWKVFTDTTVTYDVQTVFDELIWKQSSTLSAQRFFMTVGKDETCNPCSYKFQYARTPSAASPIVARMDAPFKGISDTENQTDEFKIRHRVWVPGSQPSGVDGAGLPILVLEQTYEIFSTHFYGAPAPDAFAGSRPDA